MACSASGSSFGGLSLGQPSQGRRRSRRAPPASCRPARARTERRSSRPARPARMLGDSRDDRASTVPSGPPASACSQTPGGTRGRGPPRRTSPRRRASGLPFRAPAARTTARRRPPSSVRGRSAMPSRPPGGPADRGRSTTRATTRRDAGESAEGHARPAPDARRRMLHRRHDGGALSPPGPRRPKHAEAVQRPDRVDRPGVQADGVDRPVVQGQLARDGRPSCPARRAAAARAAARACCHSSAPRRAPPGRPSDRASAASLGLPSL